MSDETIDTGTGAAPDTQAQETQAPEGLEKESSASEQVDSVEQKTESNPGFGDSLLGEFAKEEGEETKEEKAEEQSSEESKEEQGAPEEYENFKTPSGLEMDNQVSDEFKAVARELNLPQDKAQAIVDRMGKVIAQNQFDAVKAISDQWRKESEADPEIGGTKLEESRANIGRLVRTFGRGSDGKIDPDIAAFMALPSCNHKGLLKLLSRAGKSIGEAKFPQGGAKDSVGVADVYNMKL